MKSSPKKRTSRKARKAQPAWPTLPQVLRQLGIVLLVIAIWVGLLVGYLSLTRSSKQPAAETPPPTEAVIAPTTAAEPSPARTDTPAISFSADVLPLLKDRCERCHGDQQTYAGLNLSTYADVMAGSEGEPVVIPGSASTSRLVEVIVTGQMPRGGAKLSADEIETISAWVDAGALDN